MDQPTPNTKTTVSNIDIAAEKVEIKPAASNEAQIDTDKLRAADEERRTAGQRRISLIWEITQASVAIITIVMTTVVAAYLAINGGQPALLLLGQAHGVIVGFYFSRVNHQRVGGTGEDRVQTFGR